MSKSLGNTIGINEEPNQMFGKVMSISDELMMRYYEILTEADLESVKKMHPKEAKLQLGQAIVDMFYPQPAGREAREFFERTFSQHQVPQDVPEFILKEGNKIVDILMATKTVASKNEARRLLKENAVSHEGVVINDEDWVAIPGVLKVGKRRFLKLCAGA